MPRHLNGVFSDDIDFIEYFDEEDNAAKDGAKYFLNYSVI